MGHTRALPLLGNEHSHEKPYYLNACLIKSNGPDVAETGKEILLNILQEQ